jgi:hypothetical protein
MKYALLVHQPKEVFEHRDDKAAIAAGRAYGEALQAAGIFVAGAGLGFTADFRRPSQCAAGNAMYTTDLMPRRKSFSPDSASSTYQTSTLHWKMFVRFRNGLRFLSDLLEKLLRFLSHLTASHGLDHAVTGFCDAR